MQSISIDYSIQAIEEKKKNYVCCVCDGRDVHRQQQRGGGERERAIFNYTHIIKEVGISFWPSSSLKPFFRFKRRN